jgi:TonB-linked SusC/RagA family outer membrane protein
MALRRLSSWIAASALAVGLLIGMAATAAAQGATVSGRVTARGTNDPVPQARVMVVGTSLFTVTNPEGRYTLRGVPPGTHSVRAIRVGYQEQRRPITVTAGETATLDISLQQAVVQLAEVVTTATGEARRVELGNAIANIDANRITATGPVASMNDLLNARAPGVQVLPGNLTGTGARVRIRGQNSVSLSNDPIYIIDGIRMTSNSGSASIGVGGAIPSRVGDINPDEIESIEVVKGPSAATLYGTDAANGVIVINTKRGRAGRAHWNAYVEGGAVRDSHEYPTAYTLAGHTPAGAAAVCTLRTVVLGTCVADSLRAFNLFEDPETTPLGTGYRSQYGVQLSGGSEAVRFFTSAEYEDETGLMKIPQFDVRRLRTQNVDIRDEWMRPNALNRFSGRVNVNATVSPQLDLAASTNFINLNQRLPQTDNNTTGLLSSAYGGPGFKTNTNAAGEPLFGYRAFTPGDMFQETVTQGINRFIGSINANWRPTSWMQNRLNVGIDHTGRVETDLCRRANCSDFSTNRLGFSEDNRTNIRNFTVDIGTSGSWQVTEAWNSKTTVGTQYVNYKFDRNGAFGEQLPPGAVTPAAGAVQEVEAATTIARTLGFFLEEAVSFRERLFLTAAVRTDQNSAFGTNFQRVVYPKASLSWIVSEEGFFPRPIWLQQLRLRASYGASGVQPGPNDALRYFEANNVAVDKADEPKSDQPAIQFEALGNRNLKPERATEFEGGFDSQLFGNRATLELTYYTKLTQDALIERVLPPSLGAGATTRQQNLGSVSNSGFELLVSTQFVNTPRFGWDASLSGSTNRNRLVTLGPGVAPIVGATTRRQPGYPVFAYWQRKITHYEDKNGDGILTYYADPALNEVFVADSNTFVGQVLPKYQVVLNNGVEFLGRRLRVQTLLDYRGGHKLLNGTERIRCQNRNNCRGLSDRTAPLKVQAATVALRDHPSRTQAGYMEDASILRLRELSATYSLPDRLAARLLRGRSASLTFAARNVAYWSRYSGIDPESDADAGAAETDVPSDFQTAPPPSYFTLRLNLGF